MNAPANAAASTGSDYPEIRDSVRRICEKFPGDYWRDLDERGAYPEAFVQALTEAGFLSVLIPEEFGGSGLPLGAAAAILQEINANGCSANCAHAQMYIMGTLLRHGSEEQRRAVLPGIAAGELRLQAFGISEPTTGSDTTQLRTMAVREEDSYVIRGQKVWTSRALFSDYILLLARTTPLDQVTKRTEGLSVFLIDMRAAIGKGMEIRPIKTMVNHNTTEIFFDDLRIPAASLVGEEGKGFRYILDSMNAERILIASECIGDGRWLLGKGVSYANERKVFGRPIGQNQGIQFPLARVHVSLEAAALMVERAMALFEAGQPCGAEANMAVLLASEATWNAADTTFQTFGGFAFARDYDVERKWREARLYRTAPVSTNLILSHVAQHALGLPRSY
ncbi:acyl-CoA dehydrogenase family protein [Aquibium sp. LZ166]|uniref:Acyl-CoA dehydrogenase family protein n=1 Tax=Aquibium pacificus TaxID=3153579 RepID=A0ABV3SNN2_9HYPH